MFLGLRTVIYPTTDLAAAKAWWTAVLGIEPYFDQPFYVGFDVGGHELGIDPDADVAGGPVAYWGVAELDGAAAAIIEQGATERSPVTEVGDGIRVATFADPGGLLIGLIENPHFVAAPAPDSPGPGT